jgi:hypothetical protein
MVQAPISRAVGTAYEEHGLKGSIRLFFINGIWAIPPRPAVYCVPTARGVCEHFDSTDITYLRHA